MEGRVEDRRMRKKRSENLCVVFWHQMYGLLLHQKRHFCTPILQIFNSNWVSNVGDKNIPPQNMPLWHRDYFELEANENQQLEKEAFLERLYITKSRNFWEKEDCYKSLLLGKFYGHEKDKVKTEMDMHKKNLIPIVPPYIYIALVTLRSLKPFSFALWILYKFIILH